MYTPSKKLALAALVAVSGALVFAEKAAASPLAYRMVALIDVNNDGVITRAEVRRHRAERFAFMDSNRNGVLDRGDLRPLQARLFGTERFFTFLKVQDANKDGVVTFEELKTGPMPAFDAADVNKDNKLTAGEIESFAAAALASR